MNETEDNKFTEDVPEMLDAIFSLGMSRTIFFILILAFYHILTSMLIVTCLLNQTMLKLHAALLMALMIVLQKS